MITSPPPPMKRGGKHAVMESVPCFLPSVTRQGHTPFPIYEEQESMHTPGFLAHSGAGWHRSSAPSW